MRYGRCAERLSSPRRGRCTMRAFAWGSTHALLSARGGLPASPCATARRHLNRASRSAGERTPPALRPTPGDHAAAVSLFRIRGHGAFERSLRTLEVHPSPAIARVDRRPRLRDKRGIRMAAAFRFLVEPAMIGGSSRSTRAGTRCRVSARDRLTGGRDDAHQKPSLQNTTRDPVNVRMPGLHAGRCDYARRGAPSLRKSGKYSRLSGEGMVGLVCSEFDEFADAPRAWTGATCPSRPRASRGACARSNRARSC